MLDVSPLTNAAAADAAAFKVRLTLASESAE